MDPNIKPEVVALWAVTAFLFTTLTFVAVILADHEKRVVKLEHMQDCVIAQGVNCR